MECVFMNEAEELAVIKYVVTVDEADRFGRKYGISISVINDGDTRSLKSIFFTYEEAEMTAEFLCRHKVMPCTAEDVLSDLLKTID